MTLYGRTIFMLSVAILIAASCTKPVLIGSDFLDEEKASLNFQDTFDLSFFTEKSDSIIVHSDQVNLQVDNFLLGEIHEPIFGTYKSEIFAEALLSTVALEIRESVLDSVILTLKYDSTGSYGSITDPVTIEVYRMLESPTFNTEYYSDQTFLTESEVLGSTIIVPKPTDSVTIIKPGVDTQTIAPHIRIPLSLSKLADFVTQDSVVFSNQDSFLHYFNGVNMRMANVTNTMLGIDLTNAVSGITFYYHKGTLSDRSYKFVFTSGGVKTVHQQHDYTGSFAESSLTADPELNYWFVQGMSGLTTAMKINDLDKISPAIINQAELEVYCSFPDGDIPALYPPIPYLVTQEKTDTSFINSVDAAVGLIRTSGDISSTAYKTFYGGVLEKVSTGTPDVYRYTMKVTAQLKDIFQENKENIIYFNPLNKVDVPNRSVMFGPGHPDYAPRLRIYYTAL
ncbi:MAG: DUF4270 domain-containing protein [Bacteroidota bacterium]|nr:DUF4270 domain-containing protein [Bacteroidota bacterium]